MKNIVEVKDIVNNIDKYILVDLRSPIEYEAGCIKGAVNIPLLDNEARKLIGTLYKDDEKEAYKEGLKIGTERLPGIYDEVIKLKEKYPQKELVFYCFRGGMRSSAVVNMINLLKIKSFKLNGGYKKYRQYILENLAINLNKIKWLVVTGNTGSGKTLVLNKLKEKNYPVIDLEGLANHRGSVFGSIGMEEEVTQKNFEEQLFYELKKYVDNKRFNIFVESESRKIGGISLPNELFNKLKESPHILLNVSIDKRVEIIKEIYNPITIDKEAIKEILKTNDHFKMKLGKQQIMELIDLIDKGDYELFIKKILGDYYDELYGKSHKQYSYELVVESDDINEIVKMLIKYYNNYCI